MLTGGRTPAVKFPSQLARRIHNVFAPEEGCGHATTVDVFSGVNETPLLRGIEFTHAPSQAGKVCKMRWKTQARKLAKPESDRDLRLLPNSKASDEERGRLR